MAQTTSAFIVSPHLLNALGQLAAADDRDQFWARLHAEGSEIEPDQACSTSLFAGLAAFLDHSGIKLPLNPDHAIAGAIAGLRAGLMVCASGADATLLLGELGQRQFEPEKMQWFYEEYMRASYPDSGFAMLAALRFLTAGLMQVQHGDSWLLMFVS